ncbi:M23 family metallopeptidase [Methanoregula sp.]|uniref:M23 family metallopeptidase n=1 Tax=Methanoregula sp. TaxID=2052170 RepID=UPI0026072977|nr:M23 family metallopeptidase [Methanoregula sp.]MDD5143075.1 M23 family metallopeptidase [Methanoregula sp.]
MPGKSTFLFIVIVIALLLAAGCAQSQQASSRQPPATAAPTATTPSVTITVPFGPIPVESMNGVNIAYELEFSGMENMSFVPEKVEVIDAATGKVLYSPNASVLAKLSHRASVPPPTAAEMQNGTARITKPRISVWFVISPDAVPERLTHRVTLNRTADNLTALTLTGGDVMVQKNLKPVVVDSPVRGPGWAVLETTSPMVHHVTSQITMSGVTRVPQRYAQDFLYLDPVTGKAYHDDMTIARNFYGFEKELFAVSNGTVSYARDGIPDIEITTQKPAPSFDTALGNGVVIDLGNNKYACYGHMVNGSVRVKTGDTVTTGQVIGLMGNTGNSDAPHLHFQVITGSSSPLGGEGYPIVYRSFAITGTFDEDAIVGMSFATPIPQQERIMENDVIVSFP